MSNREKTNQLLNMLLEVIEPRELLIFIITDYLSGSEALDCVKYLFNEFMPEEELE